MEHEVQQLSKEFDRSKSKLQQSTDKNSLFEFFLAQAKERDTKARLEKLAASKFGKRRSRSSSMNRSRNNVLAEQSSTLTKSIDLPSSYSTNISTSGLRRSRSNVDVKKIISKVELRDLQARAEAKLQRVQRRDSTSSQPSQQTLKSRKELEPDSTTLSRHTKLNNSFSSLPDQPLVFDTRQTSPSKSTSSSHHRKFSSFLNNSRVTRPAGMYYLVKCLPEDNKREINQSSLRRTHSARSSTWTGCEIRYLEHSLLNTNPEMFEASKQNKGLHIQDENNNYNVDYLNTCEAPRSIKTTEHLQRNKSTSQTSLDTNSTAQDISNRNEEKSIDVSFDVKSCDEPLTERSNNFNFDLLPLPPPEFFQNEDEELETIQNHLNDVETSSNECKDNDRMRWQNEQKIKKERAEARAKQEVKRREQRQSQKMQREDKRRKEIETQSGHNCRSEQITAQTEKEDQEKKWNDNYNDLLGGESPGTAIERTPVRHRSRACGCVFGRTLKGMPKGGHEDWLPRLPVHLI